MVNGLAAQLPCRLTARLLGWPEERWPDVKSWSERLMRYDRIHLEPQVAMDMMMAIIEFNTDLQGMAAERRGCPVHHDSDLVAVWANATVGGEPLDDATLMHETGLLHLGWRRDHADGHRPCPARLLRPQRPVGGRGRRSVARPLRRRRDDPLGHPPTASSGPRRTTPHRRSARVRGRPRDPLYPSANHDDRPVSAQPFSFDVTRNPNPDEASGSSDYLGASLARFELGIVVEELTSRLTSLRVVEDTDD